MGREHKEFRWTVGIESSCIPHLGIDQFQWTQHDKFWKDDFKRAAHELGCKWMRYSLPWHLVEPSRNQFDWSWSDDRLGYAKELGFNLILDLVHFGTPTWLPEAFGDVEFPHALESYTEAFANSVSQYYPFCLPGQRAANHLLILGRYWTLAATWSGTRILRTCPITSRPRPEPLHSHVAPVLATNRNCSLRCA